MKAHPALFGGGGGGGREGGEPKNRGHYYSSLQLTYTFHYYSSLQLTYTFKMRTKHTKTHTAAFISAAVLSAATKLRRLTLCAFI